MEEASKTKTKKRGPVSAETASKMRAAALRRWRNPSQRMEQSQRSKSYLQENPDVALQRAEFMRTVVQPMSPASQPRV